MAVYYRYRPGLLARLGEPSRCHWVITINPHIANKFLLLLHTPSITHLLVLSTSVISPRSDAIQVWCMHAHIARICAYIQVVQNVYIQALA
jgi:hypothetical protein